MGSGVGFRKGFLDKCKINCLSVCLYLISTILHSNNETLMCSFVRAVRLESASFK
jgi:hypothetical protein